eukprot:12101674-Karenia_brevis.AAC.1
MSSPDNHPSNVMMSMFREAHIIDWGLQPWMESTSRVFCLECNLRSGADVGFDACLEQARPGTLPGEKYNFIHGCPCTPIRIATSRF